MPQSFPSTKFVNKFHFWAVFHMQQRNFIGIRSMGKGLYLLLIEIHKWSRISDKTKIYWCDWITSANIRTKCVCEVSPSTPDRFIAWRCTNDENVFLYFHGVNMTNTNRFTFLPSHHTKANCNISSSQHLLQRRNECCQYISLRFDDIKAYKGHALK